MQPIGLKGPRGLTMLLTVHIIVDQRCFSPNRSEGSNSGAAGPFGHRAIGLKAMTVHAIAACAIPIQAKALSAMTT